SGNHLDQIADFVIRPEELGTDHRLHFTLRKLLDKSPHDRNRNVFRIADTKNNFVVGILLTAVASKTFICMRICTAERLENGNGVLNASMRVAGALSKEPA